CAGAHGLAAAGMSFDYW
nr:immunoglobulin heavy chain junction region [Macaca mulatta]MOW98749.1 immunoglobulin heavy chain junction region [Macaca mulatta]MOW98871.1 immunoglobulin heavy chain junction region [Macaca mulatta]MOW99079.1 immunoglobulin heavy chain junction region [Macaca mulatta]MOW99218.1 immunoglobulin heavy chain junction region [Macaca mulatta]